MTPTPPDTALACLDEGERKLLDYMEHTQANVIQPDKLTGRVIALIRRLACELDDAKDGAEVLHEEIAKYRTQLSQRDDEIAELKGRIGEAAKELRDNEDIAVGLDNQIYSKHPYWEGGYMRTERCAKIADRLEGRETV